MNKFKQLVKAIYRSFEALQEPENQEMALKFYDNIRANVELAMKLAKPIMEIFGYSMEFNTRGISKALLNEIISEIEIEDARNN